VPAARPVVIDDLYDIRYATDAQLRADGRQIAFVRTSVSRGRDRYDSVVYLADVATGVAGRVGIGQQPRFSPDGRTLAYTRGAELWCADPEPRRVAVLPGPIRELAWHPLGHQISCVATVSARSAEPPGVHRIRGRVYKLDGAGLVYDRHPEAFIVDIRAGAVAPLVSATRGVTSVCWAPDGERIAFITPGEDADVTWQRDVRIRDVATGTESLAFRGVAAADLSWSPGGQQLAVRAGAHPYVPSMNLDLWVLAPGGGPAANLTASLDRFVGNDRLIGDVYFGFQANSQGGVWTPDGSALLFLAATNGANRLFEVAAAGGDVREWPLPDGGVAYDISTVAATGDLACVLATRESPTEVWLLPEQRRITRLNDRVTRRCTVAAPERVTWPAGPGAEAEGWLYRPAGAHAATPLLLYVHGGPYRLHNTGFFHEVQTLVGGGYSVFCPNPRGSQGYGETFASAIDNDWGNHDYLDLMSGLDAVLAAFALTPAGLGVVGGSYGGYMVNWIVTHTDRFRAAVSDRSISNLLSYLGTADGAVTFGRPLFGTPWTEPQRTALLSQSPVCYADQARTPTLIMHAIDDAVCPIEQGEQFYQALLDNGCPAELVLFEDSSHELPRRGRPSLRIRRLELIHEWFARHLPVT
jgi:dipeptidyl aminopeptidase/acylaminoacyl peptidase